MKPAIAGHGVAHPRKAGGRVFREDASPSGLTLVELTVALGVIALLAGLIGAALVAARRKANQTTCASNLRQIGQAIRLYAQDYDGLPPKLGTVTCYEGDSRPLSVIAALVPYGAAPKVWFCPSDPNRGKDRLDDGVQHWLTSYSLDGWPYLTGIGESGGPVEAPDIIGFNETARRFFWYLAHDARYYVGPGFPEIRRDSWHSGGFNVVYIDGSVRWVPMLRDRDQIPNPFWLDEPKGP
jgi:prepilin-type processing-associated H-X9-DG protein